MKTSGSGCFGLGKMPRVRVGFSGSGKPDPSLSFTTIRQSLRTPFAAKIGGIGGTLGLFSGFSIMALVEIVYWMVLALKDSLKKSCCEPFKKNHSFTSTHA